METREIKFRAWDGKEMTTTFDITSQGGVRRILLGTPSVELSYYKLMQFTGLKDKNGKEIYEGDIIKDDDLTEIYEVIWQDWYPGFGLRRPKNITTGLGTAEQELNSETSRGTIEVIGNIYENPEILNATKEQPNG
jgi:hypothetical protein